MTRVVLLEQMKAFTEETVKDLLLPVPPPHVEDVEEGSQEDFFDEESGAEEDDSKESENSADEEFSFSPPPPRAASVFRTALPEKNSALKEAPYILHQVIKSRDFQMPGELPRSEIVLRSVFCVYHENGEEGGLALLNLMERLRIAILRKRVVGGQFTIDLAAGLETLVYSNTEPPPYGTAPFYLGEIITTWKSPIIKGEVHYGKEGYSNIKRPGAGGTPGPGNACGRSTGVCGEYGGSPAGR